MNKSYISRKESSNQVKTYNRKKKMFVLAINRKWKLSYFFLVQHIQKKI